VFTKVTATVSINVLDHICLSPALLRDRLQLETGVSCDIQADKLSLLGNWGQLEKARELIKLLCQAEDRICETKVRNTDHSSSSLQRENKVCLPVSKVQATTSIRCHYSEKDFLPISFKFGWGFL